MPVIDVKSLRVSYGPLQLLDDAEFTIEDGERIGLVGRNGSGKSTLLRILANVTSPDDGQITRARGLRTGFLPQDFELDDTLTAYDNIRAGAADVAAWLDEYNRGGCTPARSAELERLLEASDGWRMDVRVKMLMDALRLPKDERETSSLSGGEKRRVAICRALVGNPDFLMLDEPTNHLDADSIEWLETAITRYGGTVLFITHDRYFLERICTRIFEIDHGKLYCYEGNYTKYLQLKAQRLDSERVHEERRLSFIRRELDWVRRGPKARGTKAKSRLDRFHEAVNQSFVNEDGEVDLLIPPAARLGNRILDLEGVGMTFGQAPLFSDLSMELQAGWRVGIVGRSGAGKTTLLKIILDELQATAGKVTIGDATVINYIDQGRESLNDANTVFDEIGDGTPFVMFDQQKVGVWGYLKRFLFEDDRINVKVGELSGGERNRLLLAKILKRGGNLLLLDEPSNDLDLATLRVLEEGLVTFNGCVVAVSHDRYFLNRVCTHILSFEEGKPAQFHVGNYESYQRTKLKREAASDEASSAEPTKQREQQPKRQRRMSWKEQKELEGMEELILEKEERIGAIETTFSQPDFYAKHGDQVKPLTAEMEELRAEVESLYARWEELEALQTAAR